MPWIDDPQIALRVLCGIWFVPHLLGKLMHADLAYLTFERAGFKPGKMFLYATVAMEALAMIGLVFGVMPKAAAGLAAIVLAGAAYAVVKINGSNWRWQKGGPEYIVFWALCCVISVV
ncbi:DoxX family protein [Sphingomonas sp. MG17]|uniref:DoxX family protein n=1 Tax=Sphingomonas tagetis TaxID=2949092 RepID=A0A9X2KNJ7_9SPHN|nr:DoxX family protein [Sphingomonas tagetis]MCP3732596.1 DoxX family protein [Sphingomonas tagetis]